MSGYKHSTASVSRSPSGFTSVSRRSKAVAKKAELLCRAKALRRKIELERRELEIQHEKEMLAIDTEMEVTRAKMEVFDMREDHDDRPVSKVKSVMSVDSLVEPVDKAASVKQWLDGVRPEDGLKGNDMDLSELKSTFITVDNINASKVNTDGMNAYYMAYQPLRKRNDTLHDLANDSSHKTPLLKGNHAEYEVSSYEYGNRHQSAIGHRPMQHTDFVSNYDKQQKRDVSVPVI